METRRKRKGYIAARVKKSQGHCHKCTNFQFGRDKGLYLWYLRLNTVPAHVRQSRLYPFPFCFSRLRSPPLPSVSWRHDAPDCMSSVRRGSGTTESQWCSHRQSHVGPALTRSQYGPSVSHQTRTCPLASGKTRYHKLRSRKQTPAFYPHFKIISSPLALS
jgi:hypothetical protein